jgi:hypothetical protein
MREASSVSGYKWGDTLLGLIQVGWKKRRSLFPSLVWFMRVIKHLFDKLDHGRNLCKGDPLVSPVCPVCGLEQDSQGHLTLVCPHPLLVEIRKSFKLRIERCVSMSGVSPSSIHIRALFLRAITPTCIDEEALGMSILLGIPTPRALALVPSSGPLSSGQQQQYQALLQTLWPLCLGFCERIWVARSNIMSAPVTVRGELDTSMGPSKFMIEFLDHTYRAHKASRQGHLEVFGIAVTPGNSGLPPGRKGTVASGIKRKKPSSNLPGGIQESGGSKRRKQVQGCGLAPLMSTASILEYSIAATAPMPTTAIQPMPGTPGPVAARTEPPLVQHKRRRLNSLEDTLTPPVEVTPCVPLANGPITVPSWSPSGPEPRSPSPPVSPTGSASSLPPEISPEATPGDVRDIILLVGLIELSDGQFERVGERDASCPPYRDTLRVRTVRRLAGEGWAVVSISMGGEERGPASFALKYRSRFKLSAIRDAGYRGKVRHVFFDFGHRMTSAYFYDCFTNPLAIFDRPDELASSCSLWIPRHEGSRDRLIQAQREREEASWPVTRVVGLQANLLYIATRIVDPFCLTAYGVYEGESVYSGFYCVAWPEKCCGKAWSASIRLTTPCDTLSQEPIANAVLPPIGTLVVSASLPPIRGSTEPSPTFKTKKTRGKKRPISELTLAPEVHDEVLQPPRPSSPIVCPPSVRLLSPVLAPPHVQAQPEHDGLTTNNPKPITRLQRKTVNRPVSYETSLEFERLPDGERLFGRIPDEHVASLLPSKVIDIPPRDHQATWISKSYHCGEGGNGLYVRFDRSGFPSAYAVASYQGESNVSLGLSVSEAITKWGTMDEYIIRDDDHDYVVSASARSAGGYANDGFENFNAFVYFDNTVKEMKICLRGVPIPGVYEILINYDHAWIPEDTRVCKNETPFWTEDRIRLLPENVQAQCRRYYRDPLSQDSSDGSPPPTQKRSREANMCAPPSRKKRRNRAMAPLAQPHAGDPMEVIVPTAVLSDRMEVIQEESCVQTQMEVCQEEDSPQGKRGRGGPKKDTKPTIISGGASPSSGNTGKAKTKLPNKFMYDFFKRYPP